MQKRKKIVWILVLLIITSMLFTACQSDDKSLETTKAETTKAETTKAETTKAETTKAEVTTESEAKETETQAPKEVNIRFAWWGGEARAQATTEMVGLFVKENPNYTIELEPGSWGTFWQKLITQISSKDAPDINQTDYQFTGDILRLGKPFVNMEDYKDIIDTSKWAEIAQSYKGEEGYTFGIPIALNVRGTFYSVPFFEKWGLDPNDDWTFEKLIEEAKRIHGEDPNAYMMHLHTDFVGYLFNDSIKAKTGKNVFNDADYTINSSTSDFAEFFSFFKELIDSGALTTAETMAAYGGSSVEQVPGWQGGDYGMFGSYISNLPTKISGTPFEIGTLRYLYLKDSVDLSNAVLPATLASIYVESPFINECAEFINWFVNDDDAILTHKTVRGFPANKIAAETLSKEGLIPQPLVATIANAEKYHGTPVSQLESNNEIKTTYIEYMNLIAYNQITTQEAAESCMEDLTSILEKLKAQAQ